MKPLHCTTNTEYSTNTGADTFQKVSEMQLEALCRAVGRDAELASDLSLQRELFHPWGSYDIPQQPLYPSLIGDDHSPYEYSVAFNGGSTELRILFEAQAQVPTLATNHLEALAVNRRLDSVYNVDFSRFRKIQDLFLPENPCPPFTLWHAVGLTAGKAPAFKVYLNPAVQGADAAKPLVIEAMARLGFATAIQKLLEKTAWRGALDELKYFSLDLSSRKSARVKVYFAHHHASAPELEKIFAVAPTHRRGDVTDFCYHLLGQGGPFMRKPLTSCFSFTEGSDSPLAVTLHMPIAHYLDDDALAADRIMSFMTRHNLPANVYARALGALSNRPLALRSGLQSYASYRRESKGLRLTAYLSPELYGREAARPRTRRVPATTRAAQRGRKSA